MSVPLVKHQVWIESRDELSALVLLLVREDVAFKVKPQPGGYLVGATMPTPPGDPQPLHQLAQAARRTR